ILRDKKTGEILKVGKSEVGTIETSRFEKYGLTAEKTGMELEMEIYTVPKEEGVTFQQPEKDLRAKLEQEGHEMPWDQTEQRLGREGPGVPGAPLPRRLRQRGWRWKMPEGLLVDANGVP